MPAHASFPLSVAVPWPVVVPLPIGFIAHAPPIPFVIGFTWLVINVWFRGPGDVAVANVLRLLSLCVAANIKTASLAKVVFIAGAMTVLVFVDDTP